MNTEKKLSVKNLTISFRTSNGKVQAVRGIDFDLYKGETLAIVGESGSGKSVTSKAILGILAGNSIVEGGEIIYDGKDLLKISEDDFHKIRGDKIAMIFQDPMSSLNPIVRIGRQLTEAMILKGKARQKESRKNFNDKLGLLCENMKKALAPNDPEKAKEIELKCKQFDKFEYKHLDLEKEYNLAHEAASEAVFDLENLIFELSKNSKRDLNYRINNDKKLALKSIQKYVVNERAEELKTLVSTISSEYSKSKKSDDFTGLMDVLTKVKDILSEALTFTQPNFFSMGYYLTYSNQELPDMNVEELNAFLRKYLDDNFMLEFIKEEKEAIIYSANESYREKEEAITFLRNNMDVFKKDNLNKAECIAAWKSLSKEVREGIDKLELVKDSFAYTFSSGLKTEIDAYFTAIVKNEKETKRFNRDTVKYNKLKEKGKDPDWKVIPAAISDLELKKYNIVHQVERLCEHYENKIKTRDSRDYDAEAIAMIDYLKEQASGVVTKVTPTMAKNKAIKLMEEVGIPEPRKRYRQYPFEFSGGMRQRIVIAIALAANPDILICDEPTTALDVTIQSQILELINDFKKRRDLSVIFITHDLGVVANMADRVAVMYAGKIVEYGTSDDIFYHAAHPYTWALLSSMPDLDTNEKLDAIPGTPPNMIYPPVGDAFAQRNKYAMKIDFERQPPMFKITDTHYAATWLLHPDAPKIDPPKAITDRIERMRRRRGENNAE
ncbi:MAG: ATP-binding cassette domain-containing protein [Clostridiales bacterium]|nr:ATP-binding cassette domain-containing protein [Clostridiales bacterium]